ncbi:MAG: DUF4012 domain-containing protein [Caldilineaceae bacterium]
MADFRQLSQLNRIIGAIILLVFLWFGAKTARAMLYLRQLSAERTEITALARTQPLFTHANQWRGALQKVDQTLLGLAQEMQPMLALAARLDPSSQFGAAARVGAELMTSGRSLVAIGQDVLAIDGLFAEGNEPPAQASQMVALARAATTFARLAEQANRIEERMDALPIDPLPAAVAEPLRQGQELARLLTAALHIAPAAPGLLGFDQPQSYLLLVQNNHELRATGGFITAVGLLKVTDGQMELLDFVDSYAIANSAVQHPWAPEPMQHHLGIDLLFLRDANWSPDFPTTAQLVRTLYAQNQGIWVDGVIALDLRAVELLVGGVGSLRVPGVAQPITPANLQMQIKEFWRNAPAGAGDANSQADDDWWRQRKDFMPLVAQALFERISSGAVDYAKLTLALVQALDERAIQLWSSDVEANGALAHAGWDGALEPTPAADFLALVDSNFGYNKVDSVLQRSLTYRVDWPTDPTQPGQAVATITYRHPLAAPDHQCDQTPRYGSTYDEMAARCYFDYVRLYAPQGSRLTDVAGVDRATVQSAPDINGTQCFGAYFELPPGQEQQVTFYYELPPVLRPQSYRLLIRRQAGAPALPVELHVASHTFQSVIEKGALLWQPTP